MTKRVAVITGSRAEFGLLDPVMRAVRAHPALELRVIVAGAHLLPPAETWREVAAAHGVEATVEMQRPGEAGRAADAAALGRGVSAFADVFSRLGPDWVVVLGDRVEAFAAASAASVAGFAVAHLHGGDRAEGVADEAMRHAITKLAHLHLPATRASAERLIRMGEREAHVHVVGSPAVDGLARVEPLDDERFGALGRPEAVFLMHPAGLAPEHERAFADAALAALAGRRTLCLMPNHDPGRDHVAAAIAAAAERRDWPVEHHLPRAEFVALLKRLASSGGVLAGNSSAGLIEAAALKLPVVDIGPRQAGRERSGNVFHAGEASVEAIRAALDRAAGVDRAAITHPYGDGRAGERTAAALALADPHDPGLLRKRCAY